METTPKPTPELLAKEEDEIEAGLAAKTFLESKSYAKAMEKLRLRYDFMWRSSELSQVERREECYRLLAALDQIEGQLQSLVTSGKMAAKARDDRAYAEEQRKPRNAGSTADASH